jgi:integrase
MARPATGQVVCDERRVSPVFALRFRAHGRREYVTLGSVSDGWTQARAELELQNILADVRRGIWRPAPSEPTPVAPTDPSFHEFASQWFEANKGAWRPNTRVDYGWQLTNHLLPFFRGHRLSQISIAEVDRYRAAKVREGVLSPTSINKTITRLAQILEVAVEYELISRNPAKGKRRRVKASRPAPVWLDRAEHIASLLDAAGELDREARADRQVPRRAILATLVFAGLRIGELCELCWRDVDLSGGRITVRASKTDAGVRQIDLLPALRDELAALKAGGRARADDLVFPTMAGGRQNPSNIRNRVLSSAVTRANERLAEAREVPLPERLTPHKLRHTFASLLVALGVDPGSVMDQLGHTDPAFTLRVYRHGMRRDTASKLALRELVGLSDWAAMGSTDGLEAAAVLSTGEFGQQKTPR